MPTSARGSSRWPAGATKGGRAPGRSHAGPHPKGHEGASSDPGGSSDVPVGRGARDGGFTLIELLVVLAIVAIGSALVVVSLRDSAQSLLDEEAERLGALLESARTEARASGITVRWEPAGAESTDGAHFRFFGLPGSARLPTHWLREGVSAEIVGARAVLLGPEPILPPQRIVLKRDERSVVLASDGLAPFARAVAAASP